MYRLIALRSSLPTPGPDRSTLQIVSSARTMTGMASNQSQFPAEHGVVSRAGPGVDRSVPPEVREIELLNRPIEIISDDYNLGDWQETPSKIIRHDGFYHMWIIDIPWAGDRGPPTPAPRGT